jgi:hypothetical protein
VPVRGTCLNIVSCFQSQYFTYFQLKYCDDENPDGIVVKRYAQPTLLYTETGIAKIWVSFIQFIYFYSIILNKM